VNAELVPRSTFADHTLRPGDRVEIIHAVGGG
jgi:sulfur carrier protein